MVNTIYLLSFVETPRKFIIAELSIRKLGSSSVLIIRLFEFTRPFLYIKCRDCMLNMLNHASIQSRHFMYKKGRVNSNNRIISADEDPSLRIESSAIINLRGVSTKLNKYKTYVCNICHQYDLSKAFKCGA